MFYWNQCFTEQVGDCSSRTRIIEKGFPSSSSIDPHVISVYVEQRQQWVKDKKEGQCQQRSGCHTSVTVTAARAQRATEHDEDGHGTGFGHIPQALRHTPRMVVFAHLSSFSASQNVCFPGCWICFPPRKDYSSVLSQPCVNTRKLLRPCGTKGPPDP